MKICSTCKEEKPLTEFYTKRNQCKQCISEKASVYHRKYYTDNKAKKVEYREAHKEHRREYITKYFRERYNSDDYFRFQQCLRHRVREAFKVYTKSRKTKAMKELGIDFEAIYEAIGPRPSPSFHLEHRIPLHVFDITNEEHIRLAHMPCNLMWLECEDNWSKGGTIPYDQINCSLKLTVIAKKIGIKFS